MSGHATRDVFNPFDGEMTPIDVELAELLPRIWQQGIRTDWSCQDAGTESSEYVGKAYIIFPTVDDVQRFLDTAAASHSEELESIYNRVVSYGALVETDGDWVQRRRFTVIGQPRDENRDYVWNDETEMDELIVYGPPRFRLTFIVYFPREDIAELERRFAVGRGEPRAGRRDGIP